MRGAAPRDNLMVIFLMKSHSFPVVLISGLVAVLLAGCTQAEGESRCPESECGPFEFRDAFFPMAVGNTWTFVDSLFTDSGVTVQGYTRSISSRQTDSSGTTWWHFLLPPQPFFGPFMQRNDTVFQIIMTRSGAELSALRFIPPPRPDTTFFTTPIDDDVPTQTSVVPIPGSYSTSAGEFQDCASYHLAGTSDYEAVHTLICAGVGPVSHDLYDSGSPGIPASHRKLRLVSYTLIR